MSEDDSEEMRAFHSSRIAFQDLQFGQSGWFIFRLSTGHDDGLPLIRLACPCNLPTASGRMKRRIAMYRVPCPSCKMNCLNMNRIAHTLMTSIN